MMIGGIAELVCGQVDQPFLLRMPTILSDLTLSNLDRMKTFRCFTSRMTVSICQIVWNSSVLLHLSSGSLASVLDIQVDTPI